MSLEVSMVCNTLLLIFFFSGGDRGWEGGGELRTESYEVCRLLLEV